MLAIICVRASADVSTAALGCTPWMRGGIAASSRCSIGRAAKIGAGCGPFCKNSALTQIAKVATVAMTMATNSRGCSPITAAKRPAVSNVVSLRDDRLGTFLHLIIGNDGNLAGPFRHQLDRLR